MIVHTAMDDSMHVVKIGQALQNGQSDVSDNFNVDRADLLVDSI